MPWFRVDEGFHAHPKVQRAGNAALGLWLRCGTYSAQYLLDGHVDDAALLAGRARPKEIDTLVRVGLWLPNGDGFVMHDYLDYNPSAEQIRAERAKSRERQAAFRARRSQGNDGASP